MPYCYYNRNIAMACKYVLLRALVFVMSGGVALGLCGPLCLDGMLHA